MRCAARRREACFVESAAVANSERRRRCKHLRLSGGEARVRVDPHGVDAGVQFRSCGTRGNRFPLRSFEWGKRVVVNPV